MFRVCSCSSPCLKPSPCLFLFAVTPSPTMSPGPDIGCQTAKELIWKEENPLLTVISGTETRKGTLTTPRTQHARCVHRRFSLGCVRLKPPRALRAARRPLCALWQMCSLIATAIDITSAWSTCRNTHNKVALHQRRTFRSRRSIQYLYWHCIPPELDTLIWQWTRGADHPPPPELVQGYAKL